MEPNADNPLDPIEEASQESFPASDSPAWAMGHEIHDAAVLNNEAAKRFEARVGGKMALLTYRRTSQELVLTHTEVPAELEGRGLGSNVVRTALEFAREQGLTVVPLCPFVVWYIRQHPEYADLVRADYRAHVTKAT